MHIPRIAMLALGVLAGTAGGVLRSGTARADANDLQIYQLDSKANGVFAAPDANATARFRMLADELGMSLSGLTLEPANTLGTSGFDFGFELAFAFINSATTIGNQQYWVTTNEPPNALVIPQLHFRKGLPYSLEIGGRLAMISNSGMFAGSGEVKWGIVEGFRYAPDLSARFQITRLFGQPDMDLTTGGLDFTLGKQFGVAGLMTLSPYVGYAITGVDSSTRAFWINPTSTTESQYQGQPINTSSSTVQGVFGEQPWNDNLYDRFYGGLQITSGVASFNAEYSYSRPSGFTGQPFPITPGLSTLGLRIALTL